MTDTYLKSSAYIGISQAPGVAARFAVVAGALLVGACSGGQSQVFDKPNWSLADKPPVSLGGPSVQPKAEPAPGRVYEYRGGRDPVTGMVRTDAPSGPRLIEIRKGDTLHGLSLTYHVSVKALMEANNLTSTTIVPGKKLVIPAG
jgi:LysM domain